MTLKSLLRPAGLISLLFFTTALVEVDAVLFDHANRTDQHGNDGVLLPRYILELAQVVGSITNDSGRGCRPGSVECGDEFYQVFENGPSSWTVVSKVTTTASSTRQSSTTFCLAVFSDSGTVQDWIYENLDPRRSEYCGDNGSGCCRVRRGFYRSYHESGYRDELEQVLSDCVERTCPDNDDKDCLVLAGFSQGAATAGVAALQLSRFNPLVVGIGPPPTVFPDCSLTNTQRWYSLINTVSTTDGLEYDTVPFLPGLGAVPLGHAFLLTEDDSGVVYLGTDTVRDIPGPFKVEAHFIQGAMGRIRSLLDGTSGVDTIRASGSASGYACNFDFECESRVCDSDSKLCVAA